MDRDILRYARAFLALGRERHFGRAGTSLGITQSAISRQLTELEGLLGFPLVQRTTRNVIFTPAGDVLWKGVMEGLELVDAAVLEAREFARGQKGLIRLGYTRVAMITVGTATVQMLRRQFPEITLQVHEMSTNTQVSAFQRDQIDLGLLHPPIEADGLDVRVVASDEVGIVVANDHPLAARTTVGINEICSNPVILYPRAVGTNLYDAVMDLYRSCAVEAPIIQECTSWETATDLAASGMGIAWVPREVVARRSVGVKFLSVDGPVPRLPIAVVSRRSDRRQTAGMIAEKVSQSANLSAP